MGESDAGSEGEAGDGMGWAQKIRRDMEVRNYGSRGRGSIGRVKFFSRDNSGTVVPGVEGRVAALEERIWSSLEMLETDFGPWKGVFFLSVSGCRSSDV